MTKAKNSWTLEHENKLASLEDVFAAAREGIVFLKVAQRLNASPEHTQTLMQREAKRKLVQMARVADWFKRNGGECVPRKPDEDGVINSWVGMFKLESASNKNKYVLEFEFARYHGFDAFDIPLTFDVYLVEQKNKKSAAKIHKFAYEWQLENLDDVKRCYKDASKWLVAHEFKLPTSK